MKGKVSQEEGTACVGEEIREAKYHRSPKELGVLGEGEVSGKAGTEDIPRPRRASGAYPRAMNEMLRFACLKVHSQVPTGTRADTKSRVGASVPQCLLLGLVRRWGAAWRWGYPGCMSNKQRVSVTDPMRKRLNTCVCLTPPHTFISLGELAADQQ